jgi:hypothetical protein
MPETADVMNRFFLFLPPYRGGRGCSSLPSQSTHGSYGVLREAQRGATPPDNDRFGLAFQRDVSNELFTALMGFTSWFFPRW